MWGHGAHIIGLVWRGAPGFEELRRGTDPVIKQALERRPNRGEEGQTAQRREGLLRVIET